MAGTIADTNEWSALVSHTSKIRQTHLRDLLTDDSRCASMKLESNGMLFDYSRQNATLETKQMLMDLARAANVEQKKASMFSGEKINKTENRAVGHTILRSPKNSPLIIDGVDCNKEVHAVLDAIEDFSNRIRGGQWLGATGKPLTNVVAVGIGGSYLGPEFLYEALDSDPANAELVKGRTLRVCFPPSPLTLQQYKVSPFYLFLCYFTSLCLLFFSIPCNAL
jgi:glucose-6-phosphate isomerase